MCAAVRDNGQILPRYRGNVQLDNTTNIIIAAPPESIESAAVTGLSVAHMIYRIGRGYHLYRSNNADFVKGGIMVVDTDGYIGGGPVSELVLEIIGECQKNDFSGIVLDTGGASTMTLVSLVGRLSSNALKYGLKLFVPENLSSAGGNTVVLLPSALSGGTLSGHIGDALAKYGAGRVALEIERIRMDFSLPAVTGAGRELTGEELQALIDRHRPQTFLSKDLCANYFTYHDKRGIRFVLYDNSASIRRKLSVASKMGIENSFLFYPHVADIIDEIIS